MPAAWEKESLPEGEAKISTRLLKSEGRTGACLLISVVDGKQDSPAQVILKSRVKVQPKTVYRLSAWVKTETAAWRGKKGISLQVRPKSRPIRW